MQLDKLVIETRVRSAWSAIDLGFRLGRNFWLRSFCLYLIIALPFFCLTLLFDSGVNSLLPYFIFWWLKPIFERPILHMMSRELFAERMSVARVLTDFWSWLKPAFFWVITWRRLSLYRGMTAPIMLLEQPDSGRYSARASVLVSKFSSQALWLNLVLYHMEAFLAFSVLALIAIFFPDMAILLYEGLAEGTRDVFMDAIYLLIMALVAPFYVAAGFMLYICRRVELEGWDIEITFRNWMSEFRAPVESGDPSSSSVDGLVEVDKP